MRIRDLGRWLCRWVPRRRDEGFAVVEAMAAFAVIAVAVPGVMGWIALSMKNDTYSRVLIRSVAMSQQEMEWLQSHCASRLREVWEVVSYDAGSPYSCTPSTFNYPRDRWLAVEDPDIARFTYRVQVDPLPGEADNHDMAQVVIHFTWETVFLGTAKNERSYVGYVSGQSVDYWESLDEWKTRAGISP